MGDRPQALMEFNPTAAYYWQLRALLALDDVRGARYVKVIKLIYPFELI
ncbi:MAG: hypothetical protein GDA44_00630 [Prochloron sp. SP5CPC1]|nr:hypothetical protein [Candidatus Paraprochloron terpiosi SP5CPC1]